MSADRELAAAFLDSYPEAAAKLLESMPDQQVGAVLTAVPTETGAAVLNRMLPTSAARCTEHLPPAVTAALLEHLPSPSCAAVLRHLPKPLGRDVAGKLRPAWLATLRLLASYPSNTIGAWMEPRVLTLSADCAIRDARRQVERSETTRPRIYVLDRERRIRGAVRSLSLLRGTESSLGAILEAAQAFWARETLTTVQDSPIWDHESEAPVANREREFVGVVSYRDLRRGQREAVRAAPVAAAERDTAELIELLLGGLDGAWRSLGDIVRPNPSREDIR